MIDIAKAIQDRFDVLFTSYGGMHEADIRNAGYPVAALEPRLTREMGEHFLRIGNEEEIGDFYTVEQIREQVRSEVALYKEARPAAVVTGFNFSNNISCRAAGVPLVWVSHSTWRWKSILEHGLSTYPDAFDIPPLKWLPEPWVTRMTIALFPLLMDRLVKPYNRVLSEYGLPPAGGMDWLWTGDHNLLAEPEDFSGLKMPSGYRYIGPLLTRRPMPLPPEVRDMPRDKPVVLFTLGSIGYPGLEAKLLEAFEGRPYRVIAPLKPHFKGTPVKVPENVVLTDYLFSNLLEPMADVAVTHGGIGTLMSVCYSGTPLVAVPIQHEQQANVECLVRKGFALSIRKTRLTPRRLFDAIDRLLDDPEARPKAMEYRKVLQAWDDPGRIKAFFEAQFG